MTEIERLYRTEAHRIWRSVRARTGDGHLADDVVAEAFAELWRRGPGVRDPAAWLWRTAFRITGGELRRRADHPVTAAEPAAACCEDGTRWHDLLDDIGRLSAMQRGAVVLCDYAGYPARDAAEMLGSTPAAVRVHLLRARRHLRATLATR